MKPAARGPAVLLVGAGHVHMAMLAQAKRLRNAGLDITLIDPGSFWYAAEPAEVMAGRMRRDDLRAAPGPVCARYGVRHCRDRAIGLDTRHRRLWLAGGARLDYDRVSLNVGVDCDLSGFDNKGSGMRAWRADTIHEIARLHDVLAHACRCGAQPHVAVVGGGRRTAEMIAGLSMAAFAERCHLAWYLSGQRVLDSAPAGASRRVARVLSLRNVDVVPATPIDGMAGGYINTRDGRRFLADYVLLAGRECSARLIRSSGLPAGAAGLQVTRRLQSLRDKRVFASGGCAELAAGRRLYAADVRRQAQVLADNLVASVSSRPLTTYGAPGDATLLDLADGRALGWYGRFWWQNRLAARWRHRRDARLRAQLCAADE